MRSSRSRWRVLAVAALLVVIVAANMVPAVRGVLARAVTSASSGALNLMGEGSQQVERAKAAQIRAEQRAASVHDADGVVRDAEALASANTSQTMSVLMARVISSTPVMNAGSDRKVEINRGRADGVDRNRAVVGPGGLVGRVTAVDEHTAEVTLLSDPSSVVGARVGNQKTLARVVGANPAGAPARGRNSLSLVLAPGGEARVGDVVVTAGSPEAEPYPAGIVIGRISAISADHGQIERAASITPSVDPSRLDVVGVLEPRRR